MKNSGSNKHDREDCLDLFKLSPVFTEEELKKAYLKLMQLYHPDKFAYDEDAFQKANAMAVKINLCNELLLTSVSKVPASYPIFTTFSEYLNTLNDRTDLNLVLNKFEKAIKPRYRTLDPPLHKKIRNQIKHELYTHQVQIIDLIRKGKNVIIVTPTSSGKSYGYMLPFFESVIQNKDTRGIFLFPLNALTNDQYDKFKDFGIGTVKRYDGSTDSKEKQRIRSNPPNALLTNPDELHHSILRTHTQWKSFFKNLQYIVLDDAHIYRGYFGSNVANIMFRLNNVIKKAGGNPQIISTTATIADAKKFIEKLAWKDFEIVDTSGAGHPDRHFVMVETAFDEEGHPLSLPINILTDEVIKLAENGHQILVFCNTRNDVDSLTYLTKDIIKIRMPRTSKLPVLKNLSPLTEENVVGYHAGYSKKIRREIEKDIKNGKIKIIFSTSALELGIDIGSLDVCILYGLPGTSNEIWQRIGRVGRNHDKPALTMIINTFSAIDRYYFANPDELLASKGRPEGPVINPMNKKLRELHLQCGYFEGLKKRDVSDKDVWKSVDSKFNKSGAYLRIPIRNSWDDDYKLTDTNGKHLGTREYERVFRDLHKGAHIWLGTNIYKLISIDYKEKKVVLEKVDPHQYYTIPIVETNVDINYNTAYEELLKVDKYELLIGHDQVDVELEVPSFTKKYIDEDESRHSTIKYPQKRNIKTRAFWLAFPPAKANAWNSLIPNFDPSFYFQVLHTLEHLLQREIIEAGYCDWNDITCLTVGDHPKTGSATIIIYDNYLHGLGISDKVYDNIETLLNEAYTRLKNCPCQEGCPACILNPSYCKDYNKFLDKEKTIQFLEPLITGKMKRIQFADDSSRSIEFPVFDRDHFKVGDEYIPGWNVIQKTDEEYVLMNKQSEIKYVPYEDTPL